MDINERAETGARLKAEGKYNCTRCVLAAFEDMLGMDPDTLTKLSAGFAAGNGNMKGTCGAITGAVMVAGMLTNGQRTPAYSRAIMDSFEEMSGATICRDLKSKESGQVLCECPESVRNAIISVANVLKL